MMNYEFECQDCGHNFEERLPIHLRSAAICPKCFSCNCTKLISKGALFNLKGKGFYKEGLQ